MAGDLVVPLDALGNDALAVGGGKATNLAALMHAGLPVPAGFCVTTAAYTEVAGDATTAEDVLARPVPEAVREAIAAAYRQLGPDVPVAVRSSATAEDLPSASFAGQHDTFLDVTGEQAVLHAVRRCWASLWTDRAVAYRAANGVDPGTVRLAVVVQQMVDAAAAGVMFTADPLSSRRGRAVIEASPGLGESVVSGTVTPDHYVVDTAAGEILGRTAGPGSALCLDDRHLRTLAGLAREVEAAFGDVPQDVEFAVDRKDRVWLVQARPITTSPAAAGGVSAEWQPPIPGSVWIRRQVVEHMPGPLAPLFDELYLSEGLERSTDLIMRQLAGQTGFHLDDLVERPPFTTINGFAYSRADTNIAPRKIPGLLRMIAKVYYAVLTQAEADWRGRALPAYLGTVERWRTSDPASLHAPALLRGVRELAAADAEYWFPVAIVVGLAKVTDALFGRFLALAIRRPELTSGLFLRGFPSKGLDADAALESLAGLARSSEALKRSVLDTPPGDWVETLPSTPGGVALLDRLDAYFREYGHQIYSLDFAEPTPADDPLPTLRSLQGRVGGEPVDVRGRHEALVRARDELTARTAASLDPVRRRAFLAAVSRARRFGRSRDDALFYLGAGWPVLRRLALELGRRLVEEGALDAADDVFYLHSAEIEAPRPEHAALARQRRALRDRRRRLRPPAAVPVTGRMRLGRLDLSAFETQKRNEPESGRLDGFAVSPGQVTAPASVVLGPGDFGRMTPGSILVCPTTTPAWTPLFGQAKGLVTDIGGVLAHGSIVAREYGIPAVMGTGSATERIRQGQVVTVDGDRGTVLLDGA
jgi:pyruvate,water dikinase